MLLTFLFQPIRAHPLAAGPLSQISLLGFSLGASPCGRGGVSGHLAIRGSPRTQASQRRAAGFGGDIQHHRPRQPGSDVCLCHWLAWLRPSDHTPTTLPSLVRRPPGMQGFHLNGWCASKTDRRFCSSAPEVSHRDQMLPMTPNLSFPAGWKLRCL